MLPEKITFPHPLPSLGDEEWRLWNNGWLLKTLTRLSDEFDFTRLPILADACDDAGVDEALSRHFREVSHYRYRGCWNKKCWAIEHLLGRPQSMVATFSLRGHQTFGDVLEPAGYLRLFVVYLEDCFDPPLYVVCAADEDSAIATFVESPPGSDCHVDPSNDAHNDDFGYWCDERGSGAGGWTDLRDNPVVVGDHLRIEPGMTDSGQLFYADNLRLFELEWDEVTYFQPGLPVCGVLAQHYRMIDE